MSEPHDSNVDIVIETVLGSPSPLSVEGGFRPSFTAVDQTKQLFSAADSLTRGIRPIVESYSKILGTGAGFRAAMDITRGLRVNATVGILGDAERIGRLVAPIANSIMGNVNTAAWSAISPQLASLNRQFSTPALLAAVVTPVKFDNLPSIRPVRAITPPDTATRDVLEDIRDILLDAPADEVIERLDRIENALVEIVAGQREARGASAGWIDYTGLGVNGLTFVLTAFTTIRGFFS